MRDERRRFAGRRVLILEQGFLKGRRGKPVHGVELFRRVTELIEQDFVDSLGTSDVYRRATLGLVGQLGDPYAVLYSPDEQDHLGSSTQKHPVYPAYPVHPRELA